MTHIERLEEAALDAWVGKGGTPEAFGNLLETAKRPMPSLPWKDASDYESTKSRMVEISKARTILYAFKEGREFLENWLDVIAPR